MQTQYSAYPANGVPGQPFDLSDPGDQVSYCAGAAIPFGVACELVGGKLYPLKDATTGAAFKPNMIGVSVYDPMREQSYPAPGQTSTASGYNAGEMVPVMRRGRIWVAWDNGGTWPASGAGRVNVWHSSDGSHNQGVFTMTAVSATVGAEIDVAPPGVQANYPELAGNFVANFATYAAAVVTLNLPSADV